MKKLVVTKEYIRPAGENDKCFYCSKPLRSAHTQECVASIFPSLRDENYINIPNGWIQWKGTDVCIDLQCTCGGSFHYDGDFMYHLKCPKCKQVYEAGGWIKLYPLDFEPEGTIVLDEEKEEVGG